MRKNLIRIITLFLVAALCGDPTTVSAVTGPFQPASSAKLIPQDAAAFQQQALIAGFVQAFTTVRKVAAGIRKTEGQASPNLASIGAETGGDLDRMSRMLRYLQRLHRVVTPKESLQSSLYRQIHELVLRYRHRPDVLEGAYIRSVRREAEKMLIAVGVPRPNRKKQIQIRLVDLPDNAHGRRFARHFIHPDGGVRAIHYPNPYGQSHVIVMRREDFTARRLAHELGEIALMQENPRLSWMEAHNHVVAAGLGGGYVSVALLPQYSEEIQEQHIDAVTQPLFLAAVKPLLEAQGIKRSEELGAQIHARVDNYINRVTERDDALVLLSDEHLEKKLPDYYMLSEHDLTQRVLDRSFEQQKHMPSDQEVLKSVLEPLFTQFGVGLNVQTVVLPALLEQVSQHTTLDVNLRDAGGFPIERLIARLKQELNLSDTHAQDLAVAFAKELGWNDVQVAEALSAQSLAASQNQIGAAVSSKVEGPSAPRRQTLHGGTHRFAALIAIVESGNLGAIKLTDVIGVNGETVEYLYNEYKQERIQTTNIHFDPRVARPLIALLRQHGYVTDLKQAQELGLKKYDESPVRSSEDIGRVNILYNGPYAPPLQSLKRFEAFIKEAAGEESGTEIHDITDFMFRVGPRYLIPGVVLGVLGRGLISYEAGLAMAILGTVLPMLISSSRLPSRALVLRAA